MRRMLNVIRPLLMSLILLVSLEQYSWADECAELDCPCPDAASDIDRILDGDDENVRGEFGLIREDGEYVPYDWRGSTQSGIRQRVPLYILTFILDQK